MFGRDRKLAGTMPNSRRPTSNKKSAEQDQDSSASDSAENLEATQILRRESETPCATPNDPPKKHGQRHSHDIDDHNDIMRPDVAALRELRMSSEAYPNTSQSRISFSARRLHQITKVIEDASLELSEEAHGQKNIEKMSNLSLEILLATLLSRNLDLDPTELIDSRGHPYPKFFLCTQELVNECGLSIPSTLLNTSSDSSTMEPRILSSHMANPSNTEFPTRRELAAPARHSFRKDTVAQREERPAYPSARSSQASLSPSSEQDQPGQTLYGTDSVLRQPSLDSRASRSGTPSSKRRMASARPYESLSTHQDQYTTARRPPSQQLLGDDEESSDETRSLSRGQTRRLRNTYYDANQEFIHADQNYTYRSDALSSQNQYAEPRTRPTRHGYNETPAETEPDNDNTSMSQRHRVGRPTIEVPLERTKGRPEFDTGRRKPRAPPG